MIKRNLKIIVKLLFYHYFINLKENVKLNKKDYFINFPYSKLRIFTTAHTAHDVFAVYTVCSTVHAALTTAVILTNGINLGTLGIAEGMQQRLSIIWRKLVRL